MKKISTWAKLGVRVFLGLALLGFLSGVQFAHASILGTTEQQGWSDMAFPSNVTGGFDLGSITLTVDANPSNDMELGGEFGPLNGGKHYGSGGTIGSAWRAYLKVSGVEIQPDGTVTNGGVVEIEFDNGAPGSVGDAYSVSGGNTGEMGDGDLLLTGTVIEVLMDATGSNTLDILYEINGGPLQTPNPDLLPDVVVFSPINRGLIRIAGGGITLPADFSSSFSIDGATINNFGVPEPGSFALALLGGTFSLAFRKRRK